MRVVVSAVDFCRNFATYQRQVQREPIQVRSHEKVTGYYVSVEDFTRIEQLLAASRRAYHPSELPAHLKQAVSAAGMGAEHDDLDELMSGR